MPAQPATPSPRPIAGWWPTPPYTCMGGPTLYDSCTDLWHSTPKPVLKDLGYPPLKLRSSLDDMKEWGCLRCTTLFMAEEPPNYCPHCGAYHQGPYVD